MIAKSSEDTAKAPADTSLAVVVVVVKVTFTDVICVWQCRFMCGGFWQGFIYVACNIRKRYLFWYSSITHNTLLHLEAPITTFSFTLILWQGVGPKGTFADVRLLLVFIFTLGNNEGGCENYWYQRPR